MVRQMFLLAISMALCGVCAAEQVMGLYSAKVLLASGTVQGYVTVNTNLDFDAHNADAVSILRKLDTFWVYTDLDQTFALPSGGHLKFAVSDPLAVKGSSVRGLTPTNGPLDGEEKGPVAKVSSKQAKLLKGKPLAFCQSHVAEGDYWFSFNKVVDQEKLNLLCENQVDDSAAAEELGLKRLASTPDVFVVSLPID